MSKKKGCKKSFGRTIAIIHFFMHRVVNRYKSSYGVCRLKTVNVQPTNTMWFPALNFICLYNMEFEVAYDGLFDARK